MGNSNSEIESESEWCGSIRFGNGVREVDYFAKFFRISGTIVAVEEIVQNKIVLVVNKVKWYGIRLIIFDDRTGGNKKLQDRQNCQVVTLSPVLGVTKDTVNTHITNIKDYFQNGKYHGAPWNILRRNYSIVAKYPPRKRWLFPVDTDSKRNHVITLLEKGDLLIFPRSQETLASYHHYAIYVGNGYVVNIDQKKNKGGAVKKKFHSICDGSECVVVEYKLIEMTPRSMIVKKALEFCDPKNPLYKGKYNLLAKNCENFARGLVEAGTDEILKNDFKPHGRSTQVDKKVDLFDMATNWDEPAPMVCVEDYPSE